MIRSISKIKAIITTVEPTNPHSSPTVQKIKSVLCSGTKLFFVCVPCKKPLPQKSPEPIAILDCITLNSRPFGSDSKPKNTRITRLLMRS
jgi:hypothetical protein